MLRAILCFALCLISVPVLAADPHWPGLLGPERNGWVSEFVPPKVWPKELKQQWQVEVGAGYSSPVVDGDHVYIHARQGEEEVVGRFDLKSGQQDWRSSYAVPFKMGGGGERHGKGPKSCAVLADGRLFTMSITGVVTGWDAESGERVWHRDYSSRFEKPHPYWGASSSPIVDGDRVMIHVGGDDEGTLVALDVTTGEEVWTQGKDGASYSSPLVVEISGVRQVVQWNHRSLVGVAVESGDLLWEYPFPHEGTNQNMPTPTFVGGRVFLGGENRGLHCLQPERDGERWTVKPRWHQDEVALDMSTAVVNADKLFGFSHYDRGRIFCADLATGEVLWKGPGRTGENVAFLSVPGHVVALVNDGTLRVIKATGESYQQVASYRVSETQTWAPPVLLSSGLLIKDQQKLTFWSWQ